MKRVARFPARGFSFIEILVATAIMAMAFLPIAGLIKDSFHKVGDQRMEAAVATYAAQVMNEWMFEKTYGSICVDLPGTGPWSAVLDRELEDGIVVQVVVNIFAVDPDTSNSINDMTFEYCRIPYHPPSGCAGGAENTISADPVDDADNLRNITSVASEIPYPGIIDSKYDETAADIPPIMVTIHMSFRWKARWEDWPLPGSPTEALWERTRKRDLICRRANLE